MAFGLGFNKAKSLGAAEKYVMQGKIPAAIQEYQKILEQDPRDLVVLNTVGDLLLRINKNSEALTYFYKLGEAYVEDGFVRNGIAVYKKITRSDATAIEAVCRLADLYTVQGQLSDARTYLNQAVEHYSKSGDTAKCVELFEKLLLMDPENAAAKQKLATVYEQAGRKDEAAAMFFSAAEGLADRANPGEAEKVLKRARELGYAGDQVDVLQARIHIDAGRGPEAVALLSAMPDLETNRSALNLLFHAHMSAGEPAAAGKVAAQIFQKFEDFAGVEQVAATLIERGDFDDVLSLYESAADAAIAQHMTQPLAEGLRNVLAQDSDNERARQLQRKVFKATGETGEFTDASEQLADILSRKGRYTEARDIYAELAKLEPANPMHRQRMMQMVQKSGGEMPAEEAASYEAAQTIEPEGAITLPAPGAPLDAETQAAVDSALSEADQQAVFLQTDEAIFTLKNALDRAPGNIALNQKLVEICEQAQRWPAAIAACEALNEAFTLTGDYDSAARYAELQTRYQAIADGKEPGAGGITSGMEAPPEFDVSAPSMAASPDASGVMEFQIPDAPPMGIAEMEVPDAASHGSGAPPPVETPSITLPEFGTEEASAATGTHEVDLSGEWESMLSVEEPAAPSGPSEADRLAEEITSHLQNGMIAEASLAIETMRAMAGDDPRFADLEAQVQQAQAAAPAEGAVADFGEIQMPAEPAAEPETSVAPMEWPSEPQAIPELAIPEPEPVAPVAPHEAPHQEEEFSLDLDHHATTAAHDEFELDLDLGEPAAPAPPPVATKPAAAATPPAAPAVSAGMADLLGAIEDSLGDFAAPAPGAPQKPMTPATPAPPPEKKGAPAASKTTSGGGLADMFADFKQEMEQDAEVDSDVENHYNMGVAFKEMGLYDEAIGEFQKAFHGAEHSPSHPNFIPVCSLLAHCFLEKNLPELAVTWLQNGLKAPGLDREGEMALRYEIGSAQEAAGQRAAAMESFMLVYALNIDYRDVADRIRSLKGN